MRGLAPAAATLHAAATLLVAWSHLSCEVAVAEGVVIQLRPVVQAAAVRLLLLLLRSRLSDAAGAARQPGPLLLLPLLHRQPCCMNVKGCRSEGRLL